MKRNEELTVKGPSRTLIWRCSIKRSGACLWKARPTLAWRPAGLLIVATLFGGVFFGASASWTIGLGGFLVGLVAAVEKPDRLERTRARCCDPQGLSPPQAAGGRPYGDHPPSRLSLAQADTLPAKPRSASAL